MCVKSAASGATACSDGVTIDDTVPTPGTVNFLHLAGVSGSSHYQVSTTSMAIEWRGFSDPANSTLRGERAQVQSNIQYYEYAIGTTVDTQDVVGWTSAGQSTHATLTGLSLMPGQIYHALVRATDHGGNRAVAVTTVGVRVDTTAPGASTVLHVQTGSAQENPQAATLATSLTAQWSRCEDAESGVVMVQWAVGSVAYADNVAVFTRAGDTGGVRDDVQIAQGASVYVTVKCTNGAGLHSIASSAMAIVDLTPPSMGRVMDGPPGQGAGDLSYQQSVAAISAHWTGFVDVHSELAGFWWCVGTVSGECDARPYAAVGLATDTSAALSLQPAAVYYTTVQACNRLGLCSTASSNGVVADSTPPLRGVVFDGLSGVDIEYQGGDRVLTAHWAGFHDPESGVVAYSWCAGTDPKGDDDVLGWTDAYLETSGVFVLAHEAALDSRKRIYVTVRATNAAGMRCEATSNGFLVDTTPPIFTDSPLVTSGNRKLKYTGKDGSSVINVVLPANTQADDSLLEAEWAVKDDESGVADTHWFLHTAHQGAEPPAVATNTGGASSIVASRLELGSGEQHTLHVSVCNGAGVCAARESLPVLVDSTRPHGGQFAEFHTATMSGKFTMTVKFSGFVDPESGVAKYRVNVYSGAIFATAARALLGSSLVTRGESSSSSEEISVALDGVTREAFPNHVQYGTVFLEVVAVNGVGLESEPLRAQMRNRLQVGVGEGEGVGGTWVLETSSSHCTVLDCTGTCTCSPIESPCDLSGPGFTTCAVQNSTNAGAHIIRPYVAPYPAELRVSAVCQPATAALACYSRMMCKPQVQHSTD